VRATSQFSFIKMKTVIVLCVLFSAVSGIFFECEFYQWTSYNQFGNVYSCWVPSISLTGNKLVEGITRASISQKTNPSVKEVVFGWDGWSTSCTGLDFIPQNIHNYFPNFNGLGFYSGCPIKALTGEELKDYHNLEWFQLRYSLIEAIPGNLFQNNHKLKLVDFRFNKIAKVGSGLLNGLQHLNSAYFDHNTCINNQVDQNRAQVLALLQELKEKCEVLAESTTKTATENSLNNGTNLDIRISTLEDQVKKLQEDNEILKNENVVEKYKELKTENQLLSTKLADLLDRVAKIETKFLY
jgi:hypothetical protein